MLAVDTNVLVRLLTGDDWKQAAAAQALFATESIWIGKTVLIETAWVLRKLYDFDDAAIRAAFTKIIGLDNVQVEDPAIVAAALSLTAQGMQFPDALHLSCRPPDASFVTFDR